VNIVAIRAQAEALVAAALGGGYRELPYQLQPEMNDERSLAAGYAVTWGAGSQIENVSQVVNIEQGLKIYITKRVFVRNDDDKVVTAVDDLYTASAAIVNKFCRDKLDLPGIVQRVKLVSMGEPRGIGEGRDIMSLSLDFRLQYTLA